MSIMSATVVNRSEDWVFVASVLGVIYIILYPLYVLFLRYQQARRISSQLVTSAYTLPTQLTPTELSYIFSSKVSKKQLYATLLDLANRSILVLRKNEGVLIAEIGPKHENNLTSHEAILFDFIKESGGEAAVDKILEGHTVKDYKTTTISGSRHYVYWWFLRQTLRDRKIIEKKMTGRYTKMIINFGLIMSLIIALVSLVSWRLIQMALNGEVDFDAAIDNAINAFTMWVVLIIPIIIVSFVALRFRGRMLGRHWLLTNSYRRYVNQIISFREYVRLTHKKKLKFESRELEKNSSLHTKPYAIALGIIKE
jgi:hypothetical protein